MRQLEKKNPPKFEKDFLMADFRGFKAKNSYTRALFYSFIELLGIEKRESLFVGHTVEIKIAI